MLLKIFGSYYLNIKGRKTQINMASKGGIVIKNTVEFDFGKMYPRINMVEIHKFIRKLLLDAKINENSIFGVMAVLQAPSQIVRMKFLDEKENEFKLFLQKYAGSGQTKMGRSNLKIKIYDASLAIKYVRIGDAPFEMQLTEITRALKSYGAIMDARRDRYTGGNYLAAYQGWVTVQMVVVTDIPSYLEIGEYKVIVKYQGQKLTCRQCLRTGHVARECPDNNDDMYEKERDPVRLKEIEEIEERKRKENEERRNEENNKINEEKEGEKEIETDSSQEPEANQEAEGTEEEGEGKTGVEEEEDVRVIEETMDEIEEGLAEDESTCTNFGDEENITDPPEEKERKRSYSDVARSNTGSDSESTGGDVFEQPTTKETSSQSSENISQVQSPAAKSSKIPVIKVSDLNSKGRKLKISKTK